MPFWWEENIIPEMLNDEALLHMLPYMCKIETEDRRNSDRHDAITSTVVTFMSCPLQLSLTEVGASVFQGRATLVYPYNLMSDRQRKFVRECINRRSEWNLFNEAVVFRKTKGPGVGQPTLVLQPASVLVTLCTKVFESSAHTEPKKRVALCNIILQRVQGYIPIDKPVQRQLNEWLTRLVDAEEGMEIEQAPPQTQSDGPAGGSLKRAEPANSINKGRSSNQAEPANSIKKGPTGTRC
jgi:hypothetical protein